MQPLSTHESRVNFVPVHHARLSELPAVVDFAPIHLPAKIHEPGVHAFDYDSEVARVGVSPQSGEQILRLDPHSDLHRCPAHEVDTRLHDDEIADMDRLAEI